MMVQHTSSYVQVGKVNDDFVEMESEDEDDNESIMLRGHYPIPDSQEILDELPYRPVFKKHRGLRNTH